MEVGKGGDSSHGSPGLVSILWISLAQFFRIGSHSALAKWTYEAPSQSTSIDRPFTKDSTNRIDSVKKLWQIGTMERKREGLA
jgi:hypothetical protein